MPRVEFHLLGGCKVTVDGRALSRTSGKALALLVHLAAEAPGVHRREHLAGLLWPELPAESARHNLRQRLLSLRRTLGEGAGEPLLLQDRDSLRLNPAADWYCDVTELMAVACPPADDPCPTRLDAIKDALAGYRGELLADFDAADQLNEYADWLAAQRRRVREHVLLLSDRLCACLETRGDLAGALAFARRALEVDPGHEPAVRALMRLLPLIGRRSAAVTQYEALAAYLAEELGAQPSSETTELYHRLLHSGSAGAQQAPAARELLSQRRPVTVLALLFGDEPDLGSDPETELEALEPLQRRSAEALRRLGGFLVRAHGGALYAYFGFPTGSEGAAVQAVEAALALSEELPGAPLRIGLHSGDVISAAEEIPDIAGVTSRLALSVAARAAPGELLLSVATCRRLDDRFACVPQADDSEFFRLRVQRSRRRGCPGGDGLPMVGRRRELERLQRHWRLVREGQRRSLVLWGESGVGKTRLAQALCEYLAGDAYLDVVLHCRPELERLPLAALARLLRDRLKLREAAGDSTAVARALYRLRLENAGMLGPILGLLRGELGTPATAAHALRRLLGAVAGTRPVLLLVEDLHWADAASIRLLEAFAADLPPRTLLLFTARPGADVVPPACHELIELKPLGEHEVHALVRLYEGGDPAPSRWRELVRRSGGLPLLVQELLRTDMEPLPPRVDELLAGVLDAVGEAKWAAQGAAVLGESFQAEALERLLGLEPADCEPALRALEDAGIVERAEAPGDYRFRYSLLQAAAYRSLPRREAALLHRRAAEALRSRSAAAEQPQRVARHLSAAGRHAEACDFWADAADLANRRLQPVEAEEYARQGLAGVDQDGPELCRLRLLCALGGALLRSRGYGSDDAARVFDQAQEACERVNRPELLFSVLWGAWAVSSSQSGHEDSYRLARRLMRLAESSGDALLLAHAHAALGNSTLWLGRVARARELLAVGFAHYRDVREPPRDERYDPGVVCLAMGAWCDWLGGSLHRAVDGVERALSLARELDHPESLGFALSFAGVLRRWQRQPEATLELAAELIDLGTRHELPLWRLSGLMLRGWARAAMGLGDGLEEIAETVSAVGQAMQGVALSFLLPFAEAQLALGRAAAARQTLERAEQLAERHQERFLLPELYRLHGCAAAALGAPEEAARRLQAAQETARRHGSPMLELRALRDQGQLLRADSIAARLARLLGKVDSAPIPDLHEARAFV